MPGLRYHWLDPARTAYAMSGGINVLSVRHLAHRCVRGVSLLTFFALAYGIGGELAKCRKTVADIPRLMCRGSCLAP